MRQTIENLIRRWARTGPEAVEAPEPPTGRCLTFAQAREAALAAGTPDSPARRHAAECPRCGRLVADFREAITEGPPAEAVGGARRFRYAVAAAAAAILLLGVGLIGYLATRGPAGGAILAEAEVGLREHIEANVAVRGGAAFATGDAIMFRIRFDRPGWLMLLHVDPNGLLEELDPVPGTRQSATQAAPRTVRFGAGTHKLGPWRLVGEPGTEVFLLIAADEREDLTADRDRRMRAIRQALRAGDGVDAVVRMVRDWPAEGKVIRVTHGAKAEGT